MQGQGIRPLFEALMTQIYRRAVGMLHLRVPVLRRIHHPTIDRGDYLLRFSPTRFAILLYRYPLLPRDDEQFLSHYLAPGMTYVDVGANIGTTTLAGARAVGATGVVVAFEPHPQTFRDLSDSVALNPELAAHITLVESAVGDVTGRVAISDLAENDVNHINATGIPVSMTSLDVALEGIAHIDLLKIDVEGYERNVFRGAKKTLAKTDAVYFESCEANFAQFGYAAGELFDLLAESGFRCFAVDSADYSLTEVDKGRRCVQGYENLLARRDHRSERHQYVRCAVEAGG